jgi:hypothetical protein
MNDFFQILGTIASIGSIPLAIYLFVRTREQSRDKLRREIVKILSYQIGEDRKLSAFEIQTVINSKLRENRINTDSITVISIIEDIVSETISSPLLNNDRKERIIDNLKSIYFKGDLSGNVIASDYSKQNTKLSQHNDSIEFTDEEIAKQLEDAFTNLVDERLEQSKKLKRTEQYSTLFGFVGTLITLIATVTSFSGLINFDKINFKNELITNILLGVSVSIIASLITYLISVKLRKQKDKK